MRSFKFIVAALLLSVAFATVSFAQHHAGGRGLFYVHSARSLEKGNLSTYWHSRFFGKTGGSGTLSTTYWDIQGSVAINYGLNNHLELSLVPILYQDTNSSTPGYNVPDDLFLRFKVGSLGSPSSKMKFGVLASSRIPLAKNHNIAFEPYSAGTLEIGFSGLASYASDVLFPNESFNFDFNLGYTFHNDAGNVLTSGDTSSSASSQVTFGLGIRYPFDKWDVTAEVNGNFFVQEPAVTAFSRENYLYFTPGVSYRLANWLKLNFGADFRLSSDTEKTAGGSVPQGLPASYPDWRAHTAFQIDLRSGSSYRQDERDILVKKAETRREVFEQIVREQKETEKAEQELARIKEERIKAEEELERLRQLLEGDGKKKDQP